MMTKEERDADMTRKGRARSDHMKSVYEIVHALGLRGRQATEVGAAFTDRDAEHKADYDAAASRLEQAIVQLAGVSTAAQGHVDPRVVATPADWGWSVAYQDVVELRRKFERAIAIITRLRDQNSPRGLDAEVEAWLRDAKGAP